MQQLSHGFEPPHQRVPRPLAHFLPDRRDQRDIEGRRWRSGRLPDGSNQRTRLLRALHHLYRDYCRVCGCCDEPAASGGNNAGNSGAAAAAAAAAVATSEAVAPAPELRLAQRSRKRQTVPVNQVLLRHAAGAEVWIDAPLALELRLPRMQTALLEVLAACPFVSDPVEAMAELRASRYAAAECIEYLLEIRQLRQAALDGHLPGLVEPPPTGVPKAAVRSSGRHQQQVAALAARLSCGLAALRAGIGDLSACVAAAAGCIHAGAAAATVQADLLALSCRRFRRDARGARARRLERQVAELRARCRDEERQRRTTFNELQEQLGSIRVFAVCRLGPGEQVVSSSGPDTLRVLTSGSRMEAFHFDRVFAAAGAAPAVGGRAATMSPTAGDGLSRLPRPVGRLRRMRPAGGCVPGSNNSTGQAAAAAAKGDSSSGPRDIDADAKGDLFDELRPLIASFLDGYNVCFIAYGGEASGKTHTLHGPPGYEDAGLVYRSLAAALRDARERSDAWRLELSAGCLEIYNDALVDLGGDPRRLPGGHGQDRAPPRRLPSSSLDGGLPALFDCLRRADIRSEADALAVIRLTAGRRRVAKTALNPQSSRSHLLHLLRVSGHSLLHEERLCAFLGLLDLAGAENVVKAATLNDPKRSAEAGHINRSLASFNRLFLNLKRSSTAKSVTTYRDSRLTQLMKPFLTDHGKCCIIVTVRTDRQSLSASLSSLRFGRDARQVTLGKAKRQLV